MAFRQIKLLSFIFAIFVALVFAAPKPHIPPPPAEPNGIGHFASLEGTPPSKTNASVHQANHDQYPDKRAIYPSIWVTHYTIPPVCNNGICQKNSLDDMPHIKANGQGFTLNGLVWIGIYRLSDVKLLYSATTYARHWTGFIDGSWGYKTGLIECPGNLPADAFMAAYDYSTATWSNLWYMHRTCYIL